MFSQKIVALINKLTGFKYRQLAMIFTLAFISSILLGTVTPILTQNPTNQPSLTRQELVEEIKNKAKIHVDNSKEMDTGLIIDLYFPNTVGLSKREIADTYETEYNKLNQQKEKQNQNSPKKWFEELLKWITGIGFLGFLIRDWVRANNYLEKGLKWFYNTFPQLQISRRKAIKDYQNALIAKYEKLYISFRQNRPLEMRDIYVPLKVKESKEQSNESLIEAQKALDNHQKLMITGIPGSGKSVLLKYLTLSYAEQGLSQKSPSLIPVLLELNTLSLSDLTIESVQNKLVEIFSENNFSNANDCVDDSLKTEDSLDPPLLISLGFFGVWTFPQEITRFWRKGLVWEGIKVLYHIRSASEDKPLTGDVAGVFVVAGFIAGFIAGVIAEAIAGFIAAAIGGFIAGGIAGAIGGAIGGFIAGAIGGGIAGFIAGQITYTVFEAYNELGAFVSVGSLAGGIAGAFSGAVAGFFPGFFPGAIAGAIAGVSAYGLIIWYKGIKQELGIIRWFSILAFPLFCWFPAVFSLVSFALLDTLSIGWPLTCLFWLITLGSCGYCWKTGQRLEAKARNPFKGILDKHLNNNQYQR